MDAGRGGDGGRKARPPALRGFAPLTQLGKRRGDTPNPLYRQRLGEPHQNEPFNRTSTKPEGFAATLTATPISVLPLAVLFTTLAVSSQ